MGRFSVFGWIAEQTRSDSSLYEMINYLAQLFDSWKFVGIMILVVSLAVMIPRDGIMLLVTGSLCIVVTWLHFDAANWLGTFPENPSDRFLDTIIGIAIPIGFFNLARKMR